MDRKTTIANAGAFGDACAARMEKMFAAKKYRVEKSRVERRRWANNYIDFNNASSPKGAIFRGILGLNVCGTLSLKVVGDNLQVKVTGKIWPLFVRILLFLVVVSSEGVLLPLAVTAVIGFFMQKSFLDSVYNDVLAWLESQNGHHGGEGGEQRNGQVAEAEGQVEWQCPLCRTQFLVEGGSVGCQFECPGCGKTLELTASGLLALPRNQPAPVPGDEEVEVSGNPDLLHEDLHGHPGPGSPESGNGTDGESLRFACPNCGKRFGVPEDSEEYLVPCPECGNQLDLTELNPL